MWGWTFETAVENTALGADYWIVSKGASGVEDCSAALLD